MKKIDYATLSLQDAIDLAVLVEEEAAERYAELALQMDAHATPDAAAFFRKMIGYETKHEEELARQRERLFGDAPRRVDRSMLWEVEAPAYDSVRAFMSVREALEVALEAEEKAYRFFVDAIAHVADPQVRAFFEELRDEEIVHQDLVKREIENLPQELAVDAADYADDPVGQ
jgi:erythrin-vacuolar iron transport family protein